MNKINKSQIKDLANLYDIKTLSQAIADKGWACLCKEGNFLSQAQAPNFYNSLVEKLEGAEQEPTFTSIEGIQTAERFEPRDIVFYNGWYYYVQNGKNAIKRTQDWTTTETVVAGNFDYQNMILCGDNLVFVKNQKFLVYNITRNELSSVIDTVLYVASEDFSTIDNVLYFGTRDGFGYISFDDLDDFENLSNNLHINTTTTRPSFKCGNIWYGVTYGGSFKKGNSFDSITEEVNTVDHPSCNVKIDDYYLVFGGSGQGSNHNTYKIEEDGTITKMRENNLSYPQAIKVVYYEGILFEADSYVSHYSTDLGISWTEIPDEEVGIYATVVLANGFCAYIDRYGSITQVETTAKEYTDTFVIDGNTVTIDYAKAQDGTKIVTEFSQITPMQIVGNYFGYCNYFFLSQAIGYQGVNLPYNSNLWTWMYVGDDYVETNVPLGNYVPFALKTDLDILPDQSGQSGKYLTTDGSTLSWAEVQGGGGTSIISTINTAVAPNTTVVNTGTDLSDDKILGVYINGLYQIDSSDYTMSTSGGESTIELATTYSTTVALNVVYATSVDIADLSYNDLSNKPSINGVTLSGDISLSSLGIQSQNLSFMNIEASTWSVSEAYPDYAYECSLPCTGVTTNSFAQVVFSPEDAASGNYATICTTSTNSVTIYGKVDTTITIPTIIVMGV